MRTPLIAPELPAKTYRLYLPGYTKVILPAMFGLFTLFGIAMVAGIFPDDRGQARAVGVVWLLVVGIFWYKIFTIPHRIDVLADGRAIFVSLAKRVELSPLAITSIKPQGNRFGIFVLKHSGGRLMFVAQFDGFHEFLTALKAANPGVELRGC